MNIIDLVIKVVILTVTLAYSGHNPGVKLSSAASSCNISSLESVKSVNRTLNSGYVSDNLYSSPYQSNSNVGDYPTNGLSSGSSWTDPKSDSYNSFKNAHRSGDNVGSEHSTNQNLLYLIIWTIIGALANIVLGILARWLQFANSYLHLGALFTWIVLFLQGKLNFYSSKLRFHSSLHVAGRELRTSAVTSFQHLFLLKTLNKT